MHNIYRRGDMWYVDFWYNKKRYRKCIGPSRKLAGKVINKLKTEVAENRFMDPWKKSPPIKFEDFINRHYLKAVEADRRRLSRLRMLKKVFGDRVIQEISSFEIEAYKVKRKREGKAEGTVDRELALIKHIFSKAVEYGMVKENPAKKVKLFKKDNTRVRFLSVEEMNRFIESCDSKIKDLVTVSLNTGLRRGELFGLEWDGVDTDHGVLTVVKSKSGKKRTVNINRTVAEILERIGGERKGFVFKGKDGGPMKESSVRKSFAKALKKAGIEDFRWHDMRHCFASNLVAKGNDLYVIKDLLGHSSLSITEKYSHIAPSAKTKAVMSLDDIIQPSRNPSQKEAEQKIVQLRH